MGNGSVPILWQCVPDCAPPPRAKEASPLKHDPVTFPEALVWIFASFHRTNTKLGFHVPNVTNAVLCTKLWLHVVSCLKPIR